MSNRSTSTAQELFDGRVVRNATGCWGWTGCCSHRYGVLRIGGRGARLQLAHRVSWEFNVGPIPDGLYVLHRCDNPPCTRPDHLFLGTHLDNIRDRVQKGRPGSQGMRGRPSANRRLSPEAVAQIVARYQTGSTRREIAAEFGISVEHAWRIGTGRARAAA